MAALIRNVAMASGESVVMLMVFWAGPAAGHRGEVAWHTAGDVMGDRAVIFSFWEPAGRMPAYLELCARTWARHLSAYRIAILDHASLGAYLPPDVYDPEGFARLTLPMQKDAIMVAVLEEHGGVFLDLDTLALRDVAPVLRTLRTTEAVMFGRHCAFLAARPHAAILKAWRERIQEKLARLRSEPGTPLPWDYTANSALNAAMDQMLEGSWCTRWPVRAVDQILSQARARLARGPGLIRLLDRVRGAWQTRCRQGAFATVHRSRLTMLSRTASGYMPEVRYWRDRALDGRARYLRYWFDPRIPLDTALRTNPMLIGLHNSWTPAWYRALSVGEVLASDCLLSRTIRHLLDA